MAIKIRPMIATKSQRYRGKALVAGQQFAAQSRDAKVLAAAGLATYATRDQARAPAVHREPAPTPTDEVAVLRADYEILAGRKPLGFWKADKLRSEIERLRAERDAAPEPAADTPDTDLE